MKFQEAIDELNARLSENPVIASRAKTRTPDDAASMAMLQALMKDSDFGGPRG